MFNLATLRKSQHNNHKLLRVAEMNAYPFRKHLETQPEPDNCPHKNKSNKGP